MLKWAENVPVLGFNSGKYDMNAIKSYMGAEGTAGKRANNFIFANFHGLRFLDMCRYLGPETDLDKFMNA